MVFKTANVTPSLFSNSIADDVEDPKRLILVLYKLHLL